VRTDPGRRPEVGETVAVELTRHHGLGNDFLITFADFVPDNGADLARRLCDRVDGIGADGLVFGTPLDGSGDATWRFTLFNSDGSSAEVSGNGLRCFGQALLRRRPAGTTNLDVVVETPAGDRRITVDGSTADLEVQAVVEMGTAAAGPSIEGIDIDLGGGQVRSAQSVDFGNPHLVLLVDEPDEVDLAVVGPSTESFFAPTGCNVHLVAVVDRATVRMRTWERGAGLTMACGSGACAAAHVLNVSGLVDGVVEVRMPGGTATVMVGDTVRLAGTATFMDAHSVDLDSDHEKAPDNG